MEKFSFDANFTSVSSPNFDFHNVMNNSDKSCVCEKYPYRQIVGRLQGLQQSVDLIFVTIQTLCRNLRVKNLQLRAKVLYYTELPKV